jgi:hypothetical protein
MSEKESWRTYDDFLMQGTLDRYTKLWARYELFQRVVDLPGDIVECADAAGFQSPVTAQGYRFRYL